MIEAGVGVKMSGVWGCGFNRFSQILPNSTETKITSFQKVPLSLEDKELPITCEISWSYIAWITDQHRILIHGFNPDQPESGVIRPESGVTAVSVLSSHLIVTDTSCTLRELRQGRLTPVTVKGVQGFKPQLFCSQETNCMAVSRENIPVEVSPCYSQHSVEFLCHPLPPLHCAIQAVCCGGDHVLLLSDVGSIFSYGSGSRGQTGHGSTESVSGQPRVIEALEGVRMLHIAAGSWHSAAVSEFGDLYTWGWNESGQLGITCRKTNNNNNQEFKIEEEEGMYSKDDDDDDNAENHDGDDDDDGGDDDDGYDGGGGGVTIQAVPCLVPLPEEGEGEEVCVTRVACGARHTAVLTAESKLLTCGWNGYGQLGVDDLYSRDCLTSVPTPQPACDPRQLSVYCGAWNTVLILNTTNSDNDVIVD
ncbi:RCC1 domain-containing protein 1-like [Argonauta hians]